MEQVNRPLSQRLGQALTKSNADLKLRDRVIAEYRRVASGQITEQQMDPTVQSLLSNLSSDKPKNNVRSSGKRTRKGSDAK